MSKLFEYYYIVSVVSRSTIEFEFRLSIHILVCPPVVRYLILSTVDYHVIKGVDLLASYAHSPSF